MFLFIIKKYLFIIIIINQTMFSVRIYQKVIFFLIYAKKYLSNVSKENNLKKWSYKKN